MTEPGIQPEPIAPTELETLGHGAQIALATRCSERVLRLVVFRDAQGQMATAYEEALTHAVRRLRESATTGRTDGLETAANDLETLVRRMQGGITTVAGLRAAQVISYSIFLALQRGPRARSRQLAAICDASAEAAELAYRLVNGGVRFEIIDAAQGIVRSNIRLNVYRDFFLSAARADLVRLRADVEGQRPVPEAFFERFLWEQDPSTWLSQWVVITDLIKEKRFEVPASLQGHEPDAAAVARIWELAWGPLWNPVLRDHRAVIENYRAAGEPASSAPRPLDLLRLTVRLPEFIDEDDARDALVDVLKSLDRLHKAYGGSGLRFEGGETFIPALDLVGVPA